MQIGQIKDRLQKIDQYVDQAARACQLATGVPDKLCNDISQLERASDEAQQLVEMEARDDRFVECVDKMEELGGRAMQSCNAARTVDQDVQRALTQAHDMLSTLKSELH